MRLVVRLRELITVRSDLDFREIGIVLTQSTRRDAESRGGNQDLGESTVPVKAMKAN